MAYRNDPEDKAAEETENKNSVKNKTDPFADKAVLVCNTGATNVC